MHCQKARKHAHFCILCTTAFIVCFLLWYVNYILTSDWSLLDPISYLRSLPMLIFVFLCNFHALLLLRNVAKNESPFFAKNILHLKWIGWLFVAFEPVNHLCQVFFNTHFPVSLGNGFHMTTTHTYGGIFLICGFVILTISTVFRYGIELQQLSDETL